MLRRVPPTRNERLIADLVASAIDLQALAQRLRNMDGLPDAAREHAASVAEAGRAVCLAAVSVNNGHVTRELTQFYGQFLSVSVRRRSAAAALDESGLLVS